MIINTEINKVLAQMREIAGSAAQPEQKPAAGDVSFSETLQNAVTKVNEQSMSASQMATDFEAGTSTANVAEVMVAMQKASVSFQAMTEVRNKLVDAYHEIMNMPI